LEPSTTYHIHLTGIVQGVGFRPFVYQLAHRMGLPGWVNNSGDGVHIVFNATPAQAEAFYTALRNDVPVLAVVQGHQMRPMAPQQLGPFEIRHSNHTAPNLPLTADFALCANCRQELHQLDHRHHGYPFVTCTHCGPRYSIATALPYDRPHTTMQPLAMCQHCAAEYNNPTDRRYYSQTNSCEACGIQLSLYHQQTLLIPNNNAAVLDAMVQQLKAGDILAVKGIGGYLLLCDAGNTASIQRLRQRKHRPRKPFAVMFANLAQAAQHAHIGRAAQHLLQSPISPVVLVPAKADGRLPMECIAPQLDTIGVLLPYAPLFELIVQRFGGPLIATSANISGSPIIYKDSDALAYLPAIADYIITHHRAIVTPQDDSVVQVYDEAAPPLTLRRARGMAPSYLGKGLTFSQPLLATGALMKSSFALHTSGHLYVSQYLGSTDTLEAQEAYNAALQHLLHLLQCRPTVLIADKHPGYFVHEKAQALAQEYDCPIALVQHHKAHLAAVLAENELLSTDQPVLGVVWDGTGWGDDGQVWGGEFFAYSQYRIERYAHLSYFPYLLGDKMAKEPRLAALALCHGMADALLQPQFTAVEWGLYQSMLRQYQGLRCSSMGRLFDAVASLLGIQPKQQYEGEAAMYLQSLATAYLTAYESASLHNYFSDTSPGPCIPTGALLQHIVQDIANGKDKGLIAAQFHHSLVCLVGRVADEGGFAQIAFSGGVFQNILLVKMLRQQWGHRYRLFFHQQLSPNDENVSFGQLVYYGYNIDHIQTTASAAQADDGTMAYTHHSIKNNVCV
jgi:hydrogenase maturation protein HypF